MSATSSIAVCLAAFNRRDKTLACLGRLQHADVPEGARLQVYLLDDASTDGTGDAVRVQFPQVRVITSKGDCWWAGGMRIAYGAALADGHDFYIWMNDDVEIRSDAIVALIETYTALKAADGREHIISGAMQDPETGRTSYGGFRLRHAWSPKHAGLVDPSPSAPTPIDLVNGNLLLIPGGVADIVGNIPAGFLHTLADWDYGLTARKAGAGLWLAPGHLGNCAGNVSNRLRWGGKGPTLVERYKKMRHPLSIDFTTYRTFLSRHFPVTAPLYLLGPYLKLPLLHLLWNTGLKR